MDGRRNIPPKLKAMFPELAGKTTTLMQKKGEVDILMGLDNSKWLPHQANNKDRPPGNVRLVKSRFSEGYMIMGSGPGTRKPKKTKHPVHTTLEGFKKGWVTLILLLIAASRGEAQEVCGTGNGGGPSAGVTPAGCGCNCPCGGPADPRVATLWWLVGLAGMITALILTPKSLVISAWSAFCYIVLSGDPENWDAGSQPSGTPGGVTFAEWRLALQRARMKHEMRCRASLADSKLRKAEYST
jgi:hypothetical protein